MLFKIIMLVILTDESMGTDFLLETASRKKKKRARNRCRERTVRVKFLSSHLTKSVFLKE